MPKEVKSYFSHFQGNQSAPERSSYGERSCAAYKLHSVRRIAFNYNALKKENMNDLVHETTSI
ncbi:hypothetical protein GmHk_09G026006 [Glycine max]|nr:hypothetical protein GmHk_09G026006 [Glycine max]